MGIFSRLGVVAKPIFAPGFNLITDFIKIPGGSVTAGVSMMFLVFCTRCIRKPFTGFMMGFAQAVIALSSGISAQVGFLVFITYTLPGIAVDLVLCWKIMDFLPLKTRMMIAGALSALAGAGMTNTLYFHMELVPFLLFYIFGILAGAVGGYIAYTIYNRVPENVWRGQERK